MVEYLKLVTVLLLFTISVNLNAKLRNEWFRINYLGCKVGYHRWSLSFLELNYGDLQTGLGVGATVFEMGNSTYKLLPVTLIFARPIGKITGPIEKGFGGPVLYPWGYQYPGAIYLQAKVSVLGIKQSTWCLSSDVALGFEKSIYQLGSIGAEFGYTTDFLSLKAKKDKYLYGVFQLNFSSWTRVDK
ncbi:MAG: hypothetical protein B5M53_02915 [Candidatus Cloacimonas sp. 4484_209]|nr:MAG: hypothetical protein B5M53_02915 [Candidatus Cloacimonas sp. 4484_209]